MVSATPSSAESSRTEPADVDPPSGQVSPAERRAATSRLIQLLPSPGSPTSNASLPADTRPGQIQVTGSGCTSARRTSTGCATEPSCRDDGTPSTGAKRG